MTVLTILSGCQKTPDNPIVIGKDIDNMIDKAGKDPVIANAGEDLRKLLNAPGKLTLETASKNGNLKIRADANVIFPNAASMPIARVKKREFSEADAENIYHALCGNSKPISPDAPPMSAYYLKQVQKLQKSNEFGLWGEKMSPEEFDRQINELMAQAASAPKSYEAVKPDFSFKDNKDDTGELLDRYVRLRFMPDDSTISEINVIQNTMVEGSFAEYTRDNVKHPAGSRLSGNSFVKAGPDITLPDIKQEDAQTLAQDTIAKLGLSEFGCTVKRAVVSFDLTPTAEGVYENQNTEGVYENQNTEGAYEFIFTRNINNVPITYTADNGLTTVHDAYFKPWMYEKIHIVIDGQGVLYLNWASPYTVKEIVSDSSTILPFSDIQAIFQRMMPIKYDFWSNDDYYSYEVNVTEVHLGLMRITEKNVGDSGLIIPVWDFFGTVTRKGKPGKPNPSEGVDDSYVYNAFITINAIDGSIIDRELGY